MTKHLRRKWGKLTDRQMAGDWLTTNTAVFADGGRYRYSLARVWEPGLPAVCFIMLNPSKAGAEQDDATVRRCIGFARRWRYGGIVVVNLFAMVATYPAQLIHADAPIGPRNDAAILEAIKGRPVVCAWGMMPRFCPLAERVPAVLQLLEQTQTPARCLALTKDGYPSHPLRLPYSKKLRPFLHRERSAA